MPTIATPSDEVLMDLYLQFFHESENIILHFKYQQQIERSKIQIYEYQSQYQKLILMKPDSFITKKIEKIKSEIDILYGTISLCVQYIEEMAFSEDQINQYLNEEIVFKQLFEKLYSQPPDPIPQVIITNSERQILASKYQYECESCHRKFDTEHGLHIHHANHIKKALNRNK